MTYATHMIRPGMTAIAAVLALSATPLLAQEVETAPVVIAPPPPAATAPTPAPTVQATTPTPVAATPSVTSTTTTTEAAPTPARRAATRTTSTRTTATRTATPRAATGPTLVSMSEPTAAAPAADVTPVDATPIPPLPVETVAAPAPAPVAEASPYEDALPVAGGLALLALAGGAHAMRRRKTSEEFEPALETQESERMIPAEPAMAPAYVAPLAARPPRARPTPRHDHVPSPIGNGALPENPELYGRHVQAAYGGPTPENPSLSLHKRLKRARFFDQRARQAAAGMATPMVPEPVLATAAATPRQAMPQMAGTSGWAVPGMRPAYQS